MSSVVCGNSTPRRRRSRDNTTARRDGDADRPIARDASDREINRRGCPRPRSRYARVRIVQYQWYVRARGRACVDNHLPGNVVNRTGQFMRGAAEVARESFVRKVFRPAQRARPPPPLNCPSHAPGVFSNGVKIQKNHIYHSLVTATGRRVSSK